MAQIRIKSLERLKALIECEVKELKGKICAGPASRDHRLAYPSLALNPLRFKFFPDQADERNPVTDEDYAAGPNKAVFNVGRWEGTIEFILGAKSAAKRYELEHQIEQMFLGGSVSLAPGLTDPAEGIMRPGVVLVDVPECYGARCAFELENDTWKNEKVFSKEWFSILHITAQVPALVFKSQVYSIDTLQLKLTKDLETVATPTSVPADTETITIAEDGTIS